MDFKKLSAQAKDLVEKRGGTEGLKKDASELREIAKGKGTLSDKAKAAAAALKESGAREPAEPAAGVSPTPEAAPKPDPKAPATGEGQGLDEVEHKAERRKERAAHEAGRDEPAR
ncbi:MAG: hypothetical protein M3Y34_03815 [Actinomycetota bacterium]|nr:hypothetical protein [Actinomycetota bacterium]